MRLLALLLTAVVSGCAAPHDGAGRPVVVAGFYPLAWAAERIGGAGVRVENLTPAGAEPHDLELSPRQAQAVGGASLVVFVGGGFQPALDDAVSTRDGPSLDVLGGGGDPHVWLDPVRFAEITQELGRALGRPAPANELALELRALDERYRVTLGHCERRTFVTTHAAFGRLAARYGLTEVSLGGRAPEAEASPRDLQRLVDDVRASGVTTVFTEPLVSDRMARTVAREAGVGVAVLDPVEGLSAARVAAGEDYLTVMRSNLVALREALGCRSRSS